MVRHFDLRWYKTLAEVARTYAGFLWWVLDPILFMVIFYLVFCVLLERGGEHFVQFLLIGLVAWCWFHSTLTHGCNALPAGSGLIRRVYLPKVLLVLPQPHGLPDRCLADGADAGRLAGLVGAGRDPARFLRADRTGLRGAAPL
jgi:hypothetical protein